MQAPGHLKNRSRPLIGGAGALALCVLAATSWAGISVSIYPETICAEFGQEFTAYVWVDSAGSGFDGYETVIRFNPTVLEFVSVQEESLMTDLCGNTWWWTAEPEEGDSTVFISHVAMCGGDTLTGPGALSSITFQAPSQPAVTEITFDYIEFYRAGYTVPDVIPHDGSVVIAEHCDGVCCVSEDCYITLENECADLSGVWHPEWDTCDPNPCDGQGIEDTGGPLDTMLLEPVPNPFATSTLLRYQVAEPSRVRIEIFDATGRVVRCLLDLNRAEASGAIDWDGRDDTGKRAEPGAYFCRLSANGKVRAQRLIVLQ